MRPVFKEVFMVGIMPLEAEQHTVPTGRVYVLPEFPDIIIKEPELTDSLHLY